MNLKEKHWLLNKNSINKKMCFTGLLILKCDYSKLKALQISRGYITCSTYAFIYMSSILYLCYVAHVYVTKINK